MSAPVALPEDADGVIVTFYSFKGGTGRSMAAANVACLLAQRAGGAGAGPFSGPRRPVLLVDWDLEAPGLHRYFEPKADDPERPGVIDYFGAVRERLAHDGALREALEGPDGGQVLEAAVPLSSFILRDVAPGVDLLRAGALTAAYAKLVAEFDWPALYRDHAPVFAAFRDLLMARYDHTLIDSRTGLTDVSGVCTMLLPEILVAVFTPNRQSLEGVTDLVARAVAYRAASTDLRPLTVFPVPSRIENAEQALRSQWRLRYESALQGVLQSAYHLDTCELSAYFDEVQLPHVSHYAYGERMAVLTQRNEAGSLHRGYARLVDRLASAIPPWEPLPVDASPATLLSAPLERTVDGAALRAQEPVRLVTEPMKAWAAAQQKDDLLLRGDELASALRWARRGEFFAANEVQFLVASVQAETFRREHEVRDERAVTQRGHRSALARLGLAVALSVGGLGTFVYYSQLKSEHDAALATLEREKSTSDAQMKALKQDAEAAAARAAKLAEEAAVAEAKAEATQQMLLAATDAAAATPDDDAKARLKTATAAAEKAQRTAESAKLQSVAWQERAEGAAQQALSATLDAKVAALNAEQGAADAVAARALAESHGAAEHDARVKAEASLAAANVQVATANAQIATCKVNAQQAKEACDGTGIQLKAAQDALRSCRGKGAK